MALVTVAGTVIRLNRTGSGFGLKESRQGSGGQTFTTYWSVFPKNPEPVQVGDAVSVSGFLGTKPTEPKENGKVYVDHTVNLATVRPADDAPVNPQAGAGRAETASGYDDTPWGTGGAQTGAQTFEDSTPF